MFRTKMFVSALALVGLSSIEPSVAQGRYGHSYQSDRYQPRVETRQVPRAPREAYELGGGVAGTIGGGIAGVRRCGPVCGGAGAYVGGKFGEEWGRRQYNDNRYEDRYYSPRAYGTQTTTPYMVRRRP